jgi:hypothetical protein
MERKYGDGESKKGWKGCKENIWVLGVDRETPGYIVMEETKRDGIRNRTRKESNKI